MKSWDAWSGKTKRFLWVDASQSGQSSCFFMTKKMFLNSSFCLCRSYGDHVQHFKVLQDRCGQYYVWDELFSSLNELVEFYHCNSIAKERTVVLRDPEHFARVSQWPVLTSSPLRAGTHQLCTSLWLFCSDVHKATQQGLYVGASSWGWFGVFRPFDLWAKTCCDIFILRKLFWKFFLTWPPVLFQPEKSPKGLGVIQHGLFWNVNFNPTSKPFKQPCSRCHCCLSSSYLSHQRFDLVDTRGCTLIGSAYLFLSRQIRDFLQTWQTISISNYLL